MEKKVLVVVDMQNDFITGAWAPQRPRPLCPGWWRRSGDLMGQCSLPRTPTGRITSRPRRGKTCRWNTACAAPGLAAGAPGGGGAEERAHRKPTFGSKGLAEVLKARHTCEGPLEEIQLIGLCTDICVISNALLLKAFLPEVKISVDAGCCGRGYAGEPRKRLKAWLPARWRSYEAAGLDWRAHGCGKDRRLPGAETPRRPLRLFGRGLVLGYGAFPGDGGDQGHGAGEHRVPAGTVPPLPRL